MSYNNTAICSSPCGTNKQCTAPDTCTCVSGWTGSDCLTRMFTNIYFKSMFVPITTQLFVTHLVAQTNNVQLLTFVHVSVDGQVVTA